MRTYRVDGRNLASGLVDVSNKEITACLYDIDTK